MSMVSLRVVKITSVFILTLIIFVFIKAGFVNNTESVVVSNQKDFFVNNVDELLYNKNSKLKLGIIDTGYDILDSEYEIIKYDASENNNEHGTLVVSTIIQYSGITNLDNNIEIVICDIGSDADPSVEYLVEAIYDLANRGVDIINISSGTYTDFPELKKAINFASEQGIIMIAASGDNSSSNYLYPASYDGVISVSTVDSNGYRLIHNNINDKIDIHVFSENVKVLVEGKAENKVEVSGSSISSALLTAFMLPILTNEDLSFEDLKNALKETATTNHEHGDNPDIAILNYSALVDTLLQ